MEFQSGKLKWFGQIIRTGDERLIKKMFSEILSPHSVGEQSEAVCKGVVWYKWKSRVVMGIFLQWSSFA